LIEHARRADQSIFEAKARTVIRYRLGALPVTRLKALLNAS
jgi:hypothetical protein